jgi:hypothetical protein
VLKHTKEFFRAWPGLIPIPRIESRLATTGLVFGKLDFIAQPSEDFYSIDRYLRL